MYSTTGRVKNGVILPDETLHSHEGARVLITFLRRVNGIEGAPADVTAQTTAALSRQPVEYIPPSELLADLLANSIHEQPLDEAAWNAQWAAIEADMNQRDLADDQREGLR